MIRLSGRADSSSSCGISKQTLHFSTADGHLKAAAVLKQADHPMTMA